MHPLPARAKVDTVSLICSRIAAGESVAAIFRSGAIGITEPTFWRWIAADKSLEAQYLEATMRRGEKYGEEIATIADEKPPIVRGRVDVGFVQWQKLRIDARQWVAQRMQPKRYGDRVTLAGDAENPFVIEDIRSQFQRRIGADVADDETPRVGSDTIQ